MTRIRNKVAPLDFASVIRADRADVFDMKSHARHRWALEQAAHVRLEKGKNIVPVAVHGVSVCMDAFLRYYFYYELNTFRKFITEARAGIRAPVDGRSNPNIAEPPVYIFLRDFYKHAIQLDPVNGTKHIVPMDKKNVLFPQYKTWFAKQHPGKGFGIKYRQFCILHSKFLKKENLHERGRTDTG